MKNMLDETFDLLIPEEMQKPHRALAVIADDLAGASDAALQFAKQGLSTVVLLDYQGIERLQAVDVISLSTNSGGMSREDAYAATHKVANLVKDFGVDMVYKKVDSALEGNIGAEMEALLDVFQAKAVLFAPAFPQNQRTTIGGYHLLNGKPLAASEVTHDLGWSIKESFIPKLLARQTALKLGQLHIDDWLGDEGSIVKKIEDMIHDGVRVIICDIWEDAQFSRLAQAALKLPWEIIWSGSAGFAQSLPLDLGFKYPKESIAPVLTLAGSASVISRRQVATQAIGERVRLFNLNPVNFLEPGNLEVYVREMALKATAMLEEGLDVTATVAQEPEVVNKTLNWGRSLGLAPAMVSERVGIGLAAFAAAVADRVRLAGVIVIGGDVAAKVCQAMQATGILVRREIDPGIPMGVLRGGPHHGMHLVTKAGSLGNADVLVKALQSIKDSWAAQHN